MRVCAQRTAFADKMKCWPQVLFLFLRLTAMLHDIIDGGAPRKIYFALSLTY
jgi:hypothetical protein